MQTDFVHLFKMFFPFEKKNPGVLREGTVLSSFLSSLSFLALCPSGFCLTIAAAKFYTLELELKKEN